MKILSLFDGISVAQQALKELGVINLDYYASEIDKYAISLTQKNFPNTIQLGDVKNVGAKWFIDNHCDLFQVDLLIGGSPCQDLSIAKKNREGLSGSRSGLFYEYLRILKEVKPKYFILENVNSMPKEAKETITKELFGIEPVMINASLVSAQNRKRLFWIGKFVRKNKNYEQVKIELPEDKGILLKDIIQFDDFNGLYSDYNNSTVIDKSRTIGAGCGITRSSTCQQVITKPVRIAKIGKGGQGDRVYSIIGKSTALSANGGGRGAKTGLYEIKGCASRTYPRYKKDGEERQKQIEIRDDEKSNAMTSVSGDSMVAIKDYVRKLTPIECERLQSIPDCYTEKGIDKNGKEINISNTQRYKALGNAFNCEVIKHILRYII